MMEYPPSQPLIRTTFSSVAGTTDRKRIIVAESDDALWYDAPRPPGATDDGGKDDDDHVAATATAASTNDQDDDDDDDSENEEEEVPDEDDDVEEKNFQSAIREDGPIIKQDEEEEPIVALARNHVQARQTAHQQQQQYTWKERGIGYAYTQYGILWIAELPNRTNHLQPGFQTLTIRNVMKKYSPSTPTLTQLQCSDWILWVSIQGPETLAGSAKIIVESQQNDCHWEFPYQLQRPGTYHVDVKLFAHFTNNHSNPDSMTTMQSSCQQKYDSTATNTMAANCCELCSHISNCTYWESLNVENSSNGTSCQLYWEKKNQPPHPLLIANTTVTANGPPEPMSPKAQFVGCASSFWGIALPQYSCLDPTLDDTIPVFPSSQFVVSEAAVLNTK
jgi:hypothetical protein